MTIRKWQLDNLYEDLERVKKLVEYQTRIIEELNERLKQGFTIVHQVQTNFTDYKK